METRRILSIVDRDSRRRAKLAYGLYALGIHVELFENIEELLGSWPRSGSILIEDVNDNVRRLVMEMTQSGQWLPIVAMSDEPATSRIVRAVLEGALDYVEWPCEASELAQTIAMAEAASQAIGSLKLREARARSRIQKLTRREREVLAGVAGGLSNRLIGERLDISPRTVEIHRANMLTKMGAHHTSEAIRIAIEASLVA
jgi:FixJ family two-component response regulator